MLVFVPSFAKVSVTDLNSRVDARVVANVDGRRDGHMDGQMDGQMGRCTNEQKTGTLYSAMPEAGTTKMMTYLWPYEDISKISSSLMGIIIAFQVMDIPFKGSNLEMLKLLKDYHQWNYL